VRTSKYNKNDLHLFAPHHQDHKRFNFQIIQNLAFLYPVPFLNTASATGGGGVLCNENKVPSHRRLLTIIFRILRRYSGFNEIDGVLPDCIDAFIPDILPVFFDQFEF
jgi:hypothetical protein